MKRFTRVVVLLPLMLVVSMAGVADYETNTTDQAAPAVAHTQVIMHAVASAFGAAPLAAQEECYKCQEETETGPHRFTETGEGVFFACDLAGCHLDWKDGQCSIHGECGVTQEEEEELEALAVALETERLPELQAVMATFADARINLEARSVDILCGDQLVARVSVPLRSMRWLAAADDAVLANSSGL